MHGEQLLRGDQLLSSSGDLEGRSALKLFRGTEPETIGPLASPKELKSWPPLKSCP
jgi:hypothetical protein